MDLLILIELTSSTINRRIVSSNLPGRGDFAPLPSLLLLSVNKVKLKLAGLWQRQPDLVHFKWGNAGAWDFLQVYPPEYSY